MERNETDTRATNLIKNAKSIAIAPSKSVGADAFTAGVGLYHAFKGIGKDVAFIYPGSVPEGYEDLIKTEDVLSEVGARELLVSIDYSDMPGSKVHYNTENGVLYLRISPVGKEYNVEKRVSASVKGYDYDLMVVIGAQVLRDLGDVYTDLMREFQKADVINFDITNTNHRFGAVNVVDDSKDSLSLLILNYLPRWDISITNKAAKALLGGITRKEPE
jgi:nanoRNase/pAp phosphatase (c-di-AMP/oligoRNAs hydrolase)